MKDLCHPVPAGKRGVALTKSTAKCRGEGRGADRRRGGADHSPVPSLSALAVNDILKTRISATVINARFIKPLDNELICDAVRKHPYFVTMEENVLSGGRGAVLELLAQKGLTGSNA